MNLGRPDRSQRLEAIAAEYALGTLSPRARRRLDTLIRRDARIATAVHGWEYRLAGFAEAVPAVTPAPRVWQGIRQRLGIDDEPRRAREPWWSSVAIWRGLATAGFALAIGVGRLTLAGPAETVLANTRALAVSLEPAGGSPTGLPTGPVLYTGAVQRMF